MNKESLRILTDKIVQGTATEADLILYNQYHNYFQSQQQPDWNEKELGSQPEIENILLERINHSLGFRQHPARIVPLYKRIWVYAAAVILIIATGTCFILTRNNSERRIVSAQNKPNSLRPVPGGNKATLTLADGSDVVLDDATNGAIASQGNTSILKLNSGQLVYRSATASQAPSNVTSLNTLSTPYGGQYKLTLADGSIVWLNSGSSLRFPASFTGTERNVELKGEAYFEIAKNAAMPFNVKVNGMEVHVLGTRFNIMGYEDEASVKTSLLEGSVKVQNQETSVMLIPGQQSQLDKQEDVLKVIHDANMDEAVAWKDGLFYFDGADIKTVMRELARWYDLDIVYQGKIDQHFTGKINRDADILKVLQMLELTEKVHFKTEGKTIIVSQSK